MAKPVFSANQRAILQLGRVTAALLAGLVNTPPVTAIVFDDKYSVHECILILMINIVYINIDDKYMNV